MSEHTEGPPSAFVRWYFSGLLAQWLALATPGQSEHLPSRRLMAPGDSIVTPTDAVRQRHGQPMRCSQDQRLTPRTMVASGLSSPCVSPFPPSASTAPPYSGWLCAFASLAGWRGHIAARRRQGDKAKQSKHIPE
ncbi:hypothetical protein V8C35DRAFT_179283 [Trichoderma chlorosporum]